MLLHKLQYFPCDAGIGTDIATINVPVAQLFHLCILGWHDANSNLCRLAQVGTVERNRRNWPTPQASPGFLAQPLKESIFHHHIPLRANSAFTIRLCDPPGCMESIRLRRQFLGLRGASPANLPAGRSPLPSALKLGRRLCAGRHERGHACMRRAEQKGGTSVFFTNRPVPFATLAAHRAIPTMYSSREFGLNSANRIHHPSRRSQPEHIQHDRVALLLELRSVDKPAPC
jgi:hypothetical protein